MLLPRPAAPQTADLRVPVPGVNFTLGFVPGVSSWEFGAVLGTMHSLNWMLKLENPKAEYWSPIGGDDHSTAMYLRSPPLPSVLARMRTHIYHPLHPPHSSSDGGNIDNVGLLSVLQRRVERIVLLISTKVPLALRSTWDPSKPGGLSNLTSHPTNTFIDADITGFFGVGAASGTGYTEANAAAAFLPLSLLLP